jgi:hypothetical protein
MEARSNKFWMASHPIVIDDRSVEPLLTRWGGEVTARGTKDRGLLALLAATGKSFVLELAMPLALTRHSFSAGQAVVATFARSLGCIPSKHDFDLYACAPLSRDSILRLHAQGEASFQAMGRGYPEGYVDVGPGYWKELTSENE